METYQDPLKKTDSKPGGPLDFAYQSHMAAHDLDSLKLSLLYTDLEKANKAQNFENQCRIIIEIADYYLQRNKFTEALKLLNAAKGIYNKHLYNQPSLNAILMTIQNKTEALETLFFKSVIQTENPVDLEKLVKAHKEKLGEIREVLKVKLKLYPSILPNDSKTNNEILEIFHWLQDEMLLLLARLFQDCRNCFTLPPPCEYALVGVGSLARGEMTPYSDIECVLLISENNFEYKDYFLKLARLFELCVINFGETDLIKGEALLPLSMLNPLPKGFSLDVHKNPAEENGKLIATVPEMAKYQMSEHYVNEPTNHLSSSLQTVVYITGSKNGESLVTSYKSKINQILDSASTESGRTLRLERTLQIISEDLNHFIPDVTVQAEGQLLDVKNDIYRLPQTILEALALHLGLKSNSTWDRIQELESQGFCTQEAAQNLAWLNCLGNFWRFKTYAFYGEQRESIDIMVRVASLSKTLTPQDTHFQHISAEELKTLERAYQILFGLHNTTIDLYESQGQSEVFKTGSMLDDSLYSTGLIASHLCQYSKAIDVFQTMAEQSAAASRLEDESKACHRLSLLHHTVGNLPKALKYAEHTLSLRETLLGNTHIMVAVSCNNLACILIEVGDYKAAKEQLEKSLAIEAKVYGSNSAKVASVLNNLGMVCSKLAEFDLALRYLNQALQISRKFTLNLSACLANLGNLSRDMGDSKKALVYFKESLTAALKRYGQTHSCLAKEYCNVAVATAEEGKLNDALRFFEQAIAVVTNQFGAEHPNNIDNLNNIGSAWKNLGNPQNAIVFLEQALTLSLKVFGKFHETTIRIYNNLGQSLQLISDLNAAKKCFTTALEICHKLELKNHPCTAVSYGNIGSIQYLLDDLATARENFEISLQILTKLHKKGHPDIAKLLGNMADLFLRMQLYDQSEEYHLKSYSILINLYEENHPEIAVHYQNYGKWLLAVGRAAEAIEKFQNSLCIFKKLFENNSSQTAVAYNNLGLAHYALGQYEAAKQVYLKAIEIHTALNTNAINGELACCYNNLATAIDKLGDLPGALNYLEKAKEMNLRLYGEHHSKVATNYNNLGYLLNRLGKAMEAKLSLEKALQLSSHLYGENSTFVASVLSNLALVYFSLQNFTEAKELEKRAYQINIGCLPTKVHPNIALNLNNLAVLSELSGDLNAALEYYQEVLTIRNQLYQGNHPDCSTTLNDIARVSENLAIAIASSKDSLKKTTKPN